MRAWPAAISPSKAQAVCEAVVGPWPRKSRLGIAVGRFAPAARTAADRPRANWRRRPWPDRRSAADGRQSDQRLPGAVDVVDAPTAEPTAVGFLRARACRPRPDRPPDRPRGGPTGPTSPARGRSGRACWDRSSRCGRQRARGTGTRDRCRDQTRPSRRRDSAWPTPSRKPECGPRPVDPAWRCAAGPRPRWPRSRGRPRATIGPRQPLLGIDGASRASICSQRHQDHDRVVDVGIELVGVFETPAARLGVDVVGPIAATANLLTSSQSTARRELACLRLEPGRSQAARSVIAVSQTGDLQGCSRTVSVFFDQQPCRCSWQ